MLRPGLRQLRRHLCVAEAVRLLEIDEARVLAAAEIKALRHKIRPARPCDSGVAELNFPMPIIARGWNVNAILCDNR